MAARAGRRRAVPVEARAARFARGLRLLLARPEAQVLAVGHALAIRYVIDAVDGRPPAARMAPIEHAFPYRLSRAEVEEVAGSIRSFYRSTAARSA